jgi:hypothetical protein
MATCPHIEICALHRRTLVDQPTVIDVYSRLYCHGRMDICARFVAMERLGPGRVPTTLFPNQLGWAAQLIRSG